MKNPSLLESLQTCHELELRAHVSLDDVISKVTQEVAELAEAVENGDVAETRKEAADVLINVLSASAKLGALPENLIRSEIAGNPTTSPVQITRMLGKWNDSVQSLRGRYSRKTTTAGEVTELTRDFVSTVLSLAHPDHALEDIVRGSVMKLSDRVEAYRPDIDLAGYVREYADFPKPGILFRDVSPILASPQAMRYVTFELAYQCRNADVICGLDARGFLFGMAVAEMLQKPFVMIRKKGKLPGVTTSEAYSLEYGENVIEIQESAIRPSQKVAIIDDLLATGGTLLAASRLVERVGGRIEKLACVISLDDGFLAGQPARKELGKYGVGSVLQYE